MTDLGAVERTPRMPVVVEERTGVMEIGPRSWKERKEGGLVETVSGIIRPYRLRIASGGIHNYICWRCGSLRNFPGGSLQYYPARWVRGRLHWESVECRCDCVVAESNRRVLRMYDAMPGARPWDHADLILYRMASLSALQQHEEAQRCGVPVTMRKLLQDYNVLGNLLTIANLEFTVERLPKIRTMLAEQWDWNTLPDECEQKVELLALAELGG